MAASVYNTRLAWKSFADLSAGLSQKGELQQFLCLEFI